LYDVNSLSRIPSLSTGVLSAVIIYPTCLDWYLLCSSLNLILF
jgi:hypothetical protein